MSRSFVRILCTVQDIAVMAVLAFLAVVMVQLANGASMAQIVRMLGAVVTQFAG